MRTREFTAPNGLKAVFSFRENTNDESTIIALFEQDYYKILDEELVPGEVFVDLGAHIGAATVLASLLGLRVIAVEALPENCELIRENLKAKVYEKAIWSESGLELPIFYGNDTETGRVHKYIGTMNLENSSAFSRERKEVKVETISLKDLFEAELVSECAFLKIDIEGAEDEVIGKAPPEVLKKIRTVRGEYHLGDYRKLLKKVNFEDCTPRVMNPIVESQTEFLWRRNARK